MSSRYRSLASIFGSGALVGPAMVVPRDGLGLQAGLQDRADTVPERSRSYNAARPPLPGTPEADLPPGSLRTGRRDPPRRAGRSPAGAPPARGSSRRSTARSG